jgi:hypothetical protein
MSNFLINPSCIFATYEISRHWPHWLESLDLSGIYVLIYRCNESVTKYAPSGLSFSSGVCKIMLNIKEIYPRCNVAYNTSLIPEKERNIESGLYTLVEASSFFVSNITSTNLVQSVV